MTIKENPGRGEPLPAYIRERQLLQILPFSKSTLRRLVIAGEFPTPISLAPRVTAYRVADVSTFLQSRRTK